LESCSISSSITVSAHTSGNIDTRLMMDVVSRSTRLGAVPRVPYSRSCIAAVSIPLHSVCGTTYSLSALTGLFRICAIAARYYTKRHDLHSQLSAFAKRLAFEVPSRGYKSVEVVQAYLLLSMWTLGPEKTFEQDRTWLMLGMAIR
jgi:hypothetical protein